jgi:hypothetical protein
LQRRTACFLIVVAIAGCGGGGGTKSDADAVAQVLKDAAHAVADGDGDKACGHLTADAQRQAALQFGGGRLGDVDCPTLVGRATVFLSPLERKQIESLEPANVQVNGDSASAAMQTQAGVPAGQGISLQLNLQRSDGDWKVSGFSNVAGLPGS